MSEVTQNVTMVSTVAEEAVEGCSQTCPTSEDLAGLATLMNGLAHKFKV